MNYEDLYANRIGGNTFGKDTAIYKFEKIKRAKAKAIKNNPDMEIIDFGVGEPDKIAPKIIRDTLKTAVDKKARIEDIQIMEFRLLKKLLLNIWIIFLMLN